MNSVTGLLVGVTAAALMVILAASAEAIPQRRQSQPNGREVDARKFSHKGRHERVTWRPDRRWPRRVPVNDNIVFPANVRDKLSNQPGPNLPGDSIVFPDASGGVPLWGWTTSAQKHSVKDKWPKHNSEFGYSPDDGPDTWPSRFPKCGGSRQSPININLKTPVEPPPGVETAIFFKHYDAPPLNLAVANSGHTLQVTGNWSEGRLPRVSALVLHGDYAVAEVHFHWGADDDEGSEHFVNGDCYPMEMHVVHFKLEYGTIEEARKQKDGLAVLSYFFKIHGRRNEELQKVIEASKQVIEPDSRVQIASFSLDKIAPPFTRNYASYLGSLTTPPCSEIVTWIVNLDPLHISSEQLAKLRKLKRNDGTRLLFNFRPVQPINNREIKYVK